MSFQMREEFTLEVVETLYKKVSFRYNLFACLYLSSVAFTVTCIGLFNHWLGGAAFALFLTYFFHVNMRAMDNGRKELQHILHTVEPLPAVKVLTQATDKVEKVEQQSHGTYL